MKNIAIFVYVNNEICFSYFDKNKGDIRNHEKL